MFELTVDDTKALSKAIEAWDIFNTFGRPLAALRDAAIRTLGEECANVFHASSVINELTKHAIEYPLPVHIRQHIEDANNSGPRWTNQAPTWEKPEPPTPEEQAEIDAEKERIRQSLNRIKTLPAARGVDPVAGEEYTPNELRLQLAQQRKILNGAEAASRKQQEIEELVRRYGKI